MPFTSNLRSIKSQTAVFVFILLLIGLTIGLSLSTRTVRDLQSSSGSDLSSRAFAAAEGGVEEALRQDLSTIANGTATTPAKFPTDNGSTFSYKVVASSAYAETLAQDRTVQLTLQDSSGNYFNGQLQLYWVRKTDTVENTAGARPSLEVTFLKSSAGTITLVPFTANAETRSNNFQNPTGATVGEFTNTLPNYTNGQSGNLLYTNLLNIQIAPSDHYTAIRIRPLYNKASILVTGNNLPANNFQITSTGVAGSAVTRVVQVTRTFPALPAIFDYVVFNGSSQPLGK